MNALLCAKKPIMAWSHGIQRTLRRYEYQFTILLFQYNYMTKSYLLIIIIIRPIYQALHALLINIVTIMRRLHQVQLYLLQKPKLLIMALTLKIQDTYISIYSPKSIKYQSLHILLGTIISIKGHCIRAKIILKEWKHELQEA